MTVDALSGDGLPAPWLRRSADFDVDEFVADLAGTHLRNQAYQSLLLALRHARTRLEGDRPAASGRAADYARAVLEIAVEWRMPAVERWAVAWLFACGDTFLRLRWSSRSRDGRVRRDGHASGSVGVLIGAGNAAVVGTMSGAVQSWTPEEGLTTVVRLEGGPVRALAVRGTRMFAGGQHTSFTTVGMDDPPPGLEPLATITAAAIGPQGWIGCGDELGRVLLYQPSAGTWSELSALPFGGGKVIALAFRGDTVLCAAWSDGSAAEWTSGSSLNETTGTWRTLTAPAAGVRAAAWDDTGERLAVATATGEVRVLGQDHPAWSHLGVKTVTWSPDGRLASASRDTVLIGDSGSRSFADSLDCVVADGTVGHIALLGSQYLITTHGTEVVQWDLSLTGSEMQADSGPVALVGVDSITAVATAHRGLAAVGTAHGHVRVYDGRGTTLAQTTLQPVGGRVYQLAPHGERWLIASHFGAFLWSPNYHTADMVKRLSTSLCTAVAGWREYHAHAEGNFVVVTHGGTRQVLTFPRTVVDISFAPNGTLAALDDGGTIRIWHPKRDSEAVAKLTAGSRLLGFGSAGPLVSEPGGTVREFAVGRALKEAIATLPAGSGPAAVYDERHFAVAHPHRGLLLGSGSFHSPVEATGHATRLAVAPRSIVAADDTRVIGYDLADPAVSGKGAIRVRIAAVADGYELGLPDGSRVLLPDAEFSDLRAMGDRTVDDLSRSVFDAGRVGELVWQAGLDLAVDTARGSSPDRPVRIELDADSEADDLPWELLHAANAPLGWFTTPPVTIVRMIKPDLRPVGGPAPTPGRKPAMLVVRGTHRTGPEGTDLLRSVDDAYELIQRRTRRSHVRLVAPRPVAVEKRSDLEDALREADLLQLWAHCAPRVVKFSDGFRLFTEQAAEEVARVRPRLVVIVGCHSGALGRLLVRRGVPCVVAMRSEVYSHTVQPLVEDFTALVLEGAPVDLAFAEALHRYVLTGQPGAAAVPMLYLATDADPALFPAARPAEPFF